MVARLCRFRSFSGERAQVLTCGGCNYAGDEFEDVARIISEYGEDSVVKLEKSSAMFPTTVSLFPENGIHHCCDVGCIQLSVGIHIAHLRHVDGHRGSIGVVIALLHSIDANGEGAANC